MSNLLMLAEVFEVLRRIINRYIQGGIGRAEFFEDWAAMGTAVELVVKDIKGPIGFGGFALSEYSVCQHCGFESMTTNGAKLHVKRMHREAA